MRYREDFRDRNFPPVRPHFGQMNLEHGSDGQEYAGDLFIYPFNFGSIATLATSTVTNTIQADSDFEWFKTTVGGNLHNLAEPWADTIQIPMTVQITDTGTGRQLFNAAMPVSNIGGLARSPFILPQPRLFKANSVVQVTFTSLSANTWDNLFFNMIGRKLWKIGHDEKVEIGHRLHRR